MEQHFRCHIDTEAVLLVTFYGAHQAPEETVAGLGCRLQGLLDSATRQPPHPSVANWTNTRLVSLLLFTGGICSTQLLLALFGKDGKACPECAYKRAQNVPTSVPTICPQACPQWAHKLAHKVPTSVPILSTPACPQGQGRRGQGMSETEDARWLDCFIGKTKTNRKMLAENTTLHCKLSHSEYLKVKTDTWLLTPSHIVWSHIMY